MAENAKKESTKPQGAMQAFVIIFCIAGTIGLAAACWLFGKYYSANEKYIESRALVLKGVETPGAKASQKMLEMWLGKYGKAMPGCLCALDRSKPEKSDTAMLLCVGFKEKRGSAAAWEMKPENLPPGVTMDVSPREEPGKHQKIVFLLSHIFSVRITSFRTGQ